MPEQTSAIEDRWHGWKVSGDQIHVGPLPGRKRIALYAARDGVIHPLAYFKSEDDAERALALMDRLVLFG